MKTFEVPPSDGDACVAAAGRCLRAAELPEHGSRRRLVPAQPQAAREGEVEPRILRNLQDLFQKFVGRVAELPQSLQESLVKYQLLWPAHQPMYDGERQNAAAVLAAKAPAAGQFRACGQKVCTMVGARVSAQCRRRSTCEADVERRNRVAECTSVPRGGRMTRQSRRAEEVQEAKKAFPPSWLGAKTDQEGPHVVEGRPGLIHIHNFEAVPQFLAGPTSHSAPLSQKKPTEIASGDGRSNLWC
mmetsp:Transcript_70251/g.228388  ORF Transcript_70251/g.228388 Transcript_70251/m.228388 type:complete len:244 (-) Transcript_70251:429-1160(-)